MAKIIDFQKSIQDMNEQDLKARIKEDELRLKKLNLLMLFLHWKTR